MNSVAIPDLLSSGSFSSPLAGSVQAPADKSLSHRALLITSMACGPSRITGLLESEDVLALMRALRALGVEIKREANDLGVLTTVFGRGVGGFCPPEEVLDMGNSGTAVRLLAGALATQRLRAHMTGDRSLCHRPMDRIIKPLSRMGASFQCREGGKLPMVIDGAPIPMPMRWKNAVASAQVKSAILLAALNTPGRTSVIEPRPSRDHTERMLRFFGVRVDISPNHTVSLNGEQEFNGRDMTIAGDPSSCAFAAAAAALTPSSRIVCTRLCINPLRMGFYRHLQAMGVDVTISAKGSMAGEEVADITITGPDVLRPVETLPNDVPSMIDEYPLLAVLCARASGVSRLRGLDELRHKESDRLDGLARNLRHCGVDARIEGDDLTITADGTLPVGGGVIDANFDHRIAMSFLILGAAAQRPINVTGCRTIATSFPDFPATMRSLGWELGGLPSPETQRCPETQR